MWNYWHVNGWEKVFTKPSPLRVVPSESHILFHHKVMHQLSFFWKKKISAMHFVDFISPFFTLGRSLPVFGVLAIRGMRLCECRESKMKLELA